MLRRALLLALSTAAPAVGQTVTSSAAPAEVALTLYRSPHRSANRPMDLDWLDGLALVTETRRIDVPAGDGEIRFEGVAGAIIPESAIVSGLPKGVIEKNQDAALLSPGSLLDRSLGSRVHLRRTALATGKVTEQEAIIRSGADNAVVLQTAAGFEALRCTGLKEALSYGRVPERLSAKPTLSVRTHSTRPVSATVTLSYLAPGFDWEANYVAKLQPDGRHVELFAWVTLASQDETSFAHAETKAVAGRVSIEDDGEDREPAKGKAIHLRCWPAGTTHGGDRMFAGVPPPPPPPPPPPMMVSASPVTVLGSQDIVVTGSRIPTREDLGDYKLYSLPERVTVAAKSQKQVALLEQPNVGVQLLYRATIWAAEEPNPPQLLLRTYNKTEWGLGLPLPAGTLALFDRYGGRPILLGEGTTPDRAVGEKAEIELGPASNVRIAGVSDRDGKTERVVLTVSNDQPRAILFEAKIPTRGRVLNFSDKVFAEGLFRIWRAELPANSSRELRYTIRAEDDG